MGFTLVPILAAGLVVVNAFPVAVPNFFGPAATITASWVEPTGYYTATQPASYVAEESGYYTGIELASHAAEPTGYYTTTQPASHIAEQSGYYTTTQPASYVAEPSGYAAAVQAEAEETAPVKYRFTPGGNIVYVEEIEHRSLS